MIETKTTTITTACPQCGGHDTYSIGQYCMANSTIDKGTMAIAMKSRGIGGAGVGVGLSGGVSLLAMKGSSVRTSGSAKTESRSTSVLALKYLPTQAPVKTSSVGSALAIFLLVFFCSMGLFAVVVNSILNYFGIYYPAGSFTAVVLSLFTLIFIVGAALMAGWMARAFYRQQEPRKKDGYQKAWETWNKRRCLLENGWVCIRCGHDWIPFLEQNRQLIADSSLAN